MAPALLDFYPLVMDSIRIQPEPQRLAHLEAKEKGEPTFVGVAPGIHNREMYLELMKSQVKVGLMFESTNHRLWRFSPTFFEGTKGT